MRRLHRMKVRRSDPEGSYPETSRREKDHGSHRERERERIVAKCAHCSGEMAAEVVSKFSPGVGIAILALGLLISLIASLLFGLPIVLIGAYLGWASRSVWRCPECGAMVDRAQ